MQKYYLSKKYKTHSSTTDWDNNLIRFQLWTDSSFNNETACLNLHMLVIVCNVYIIQYKRNNLYMPSEEEAKKPNPLLSTTSNCKKNTCAWSESRMVLSSKVSNFHFYKIWVNLSRSRGRGFTQWDRSQRRCPNTCVPCSLVDVLCLV